MRKKGLALLIGFWILVSVSGCTQFSCCGYPAYNYQCTRGTAVVYVKISGNASVVQKIVNDSLNIYQANGYTCYPWAPAYTPECIRGRERIKKALEGGDTCVNTDVNGYCVSANGAAPCVEGI